METSTILALTGMSVIGFLYLFSFDIYCCLSFRVCSSRLPTCSPGSRESAMLYKYESRDSEITELCTGDHVDRLVALRARASSEVSSAS